MVRGERKAGFDKNGVSQSSPRMSKFANAIMNANQVGKRSKKRKGKDKGENSQKEEKPWYLSTTPDHLQVPTDKLQQERWLKKELDLNKEKAALEKLRPNWKDDISASTWPDDAPDERSPGGRSVMCSHKLVAAKELSLMQHQVAVARYKEWRASEYAMKLESEKNISAAQRAYLALGLTDFEVSMDQYERANRNLALVRKNASFRPPETVPDIVVPTFDRLRDRYNLNRGRETLRLMERIGFNFHRNTFSRGGPAENRTTKKIEDENPEPVFEEEHLNVVLSPSSPLGYQLLRPGKPRAPKFLGDDPEEANGWEASALEPRDMGGEMDKMKEDLSEVGSEPEVLPEEEEGWEAALPVPGFGNRMQGNVIRIGFPLQVHTDEEKLAMKQQQASLNLSRSPPQRKELPSPQGRAATHAPRDRKIATFQEEAPRQRGLASRTGEPEPLRETFTSPRQALSPRERLQPLRSSSPPPEDEEVDKEVQLMSEFMKAACKSSADSPTRRVQPFSQGLGKPSLPAGGQASGTL